MTEHDTTKEAKLCMAIKPDGTMKIIDWQREQEAFIGQEEFDHCSCTQYDDFGYKLGLYCGDSAVNERTNDIATKIASTLTRLVRVPGNAIIIDDVKTIGMEEIKDILFMAENYQLYFGSVSLIQDEFIQSMVKSREPFESLSKKMAESKVKLMKECGVLEKHIVAFQEK